MLKKFVLFCLMIASPLLASEPLKILYLTDYDNGYHDYSWQSKFLIPELESRLNGDFTVVGRSNGELTSFLRDRNFSNGFDLVVYNACLADTRDYELADNVITQTRDLGVPMMLLHCAMHNFRGTSSDLGWVGSAKLKKDKQSWEKRFPDREFPIWWKFTGVDSNSHNFPGSLKVKKLANHPITEGFPDDWKSSWDELYLVENKTDKVIPLLTGKGDNLVAWLHPVGDSMVFGTTLGHGKTTLEDSKFLDLLGRAALFLTGKLDDNGNLDQEFTGNEIFYNYSKSIRCNPKDIIRAGTIADVQAAMRRAAAEGLKVKVVSIDNPNSYSEILCPAQGGLVINVASMNKILKVDREKKLVTVEPGMRIDLLGTALEEYQLVFPSTADFSGITIAGAMGTGAHHSSLTRHAGVHDYVHSMTLVDGRGELVTLEGEDARKAAVHLGYLGAITSITLEVEDMFKLRYGSKSGSDANLEEIFEQEIRSHDYGRVSWFVGVGRYVIDYFDKVDVTVKGDSYHNLWESTAGPTSIFGSLPYDVLNRLPQAVQCSAAAVRANVWTAPIRTINSPNSAPVGLAHRMLGSYCEKGSCPWDFGAVSRTQELAIPMSQVKDWMADVRGIIAERKACFPVLGIYMRFAKKSDAWMSSSYGEDSMMFEIHIPKESSPAKYEQGTSVYDEIQQMTWIKYGGRPHWAKNSMPIFKESLDRYPAADQFRSLKTSLDPQGLLENDFWQQINGDAKETNAPGCTLDRSCICLSTSDCATGYTCKPGSFFQEAKVCVKR